MKKIDLFFMLVIFLFAGLATSYVAFDYQLSGVDFEKQKVRALRNRVVQLKLQNEALELKLGQGSPIRGIASVGASKEISFDLLYKSQLEQAKAQRKIESVLKISQKIINTSANPELLAEAHYEKAFTNCHIIFKEEHCLQDIENIVTQFPESPWAGEALVLLSGIYTKLKRYKEAESVIKIVRSEFSHEKNILSKLDQLQKSPM